MDPGCGGGLKIASATVQAHVQRARANSHACRGTHSWFLRASHGLLPFLRFRRRFKYPCQQTTHLLLYFTVPWFMCHSGHSYISEKKFGDHAARPIVSQRTPASLTARRDYWRDPWATLQSLVINAPQSRAGQPRHKLCHNAPLTGSVAAESPLTVISK